MISQLRARRRTNLRRLMNPKHIAFVGGSHLERVVGLCRDNGYAGQMSVINPRHEALAGITCVASADDLDAAPDAAFVALSNQLTLEAVQALSKRGAGGVICHATGYGEMGGEGIEAQNALVQAAGDMALIGPNCMGLINAFDNCAMWGEYTPSQPIDDNGVALISQSGAFLYGLLSAERAFPLGYAVSVGNQAVIDSADILDAVLDDSRVRAVGIYAEGLPDGPALSAALAKAMEQEIPVVLLRGGGTAASAERSLSHTGNLAVPNDFWDALIRRFALIQVGSPKQLIEATKLLAVSGVPRGNRIFVATYSGAAGTLLAEQAPQRGLALQQMSDATVEQLRPTLPFYVAISNPFDVNLPWRTDTKVSLDDPESIAECLEIACTGITDTFVFMLDIPRRGTGGDLPWLPTIDAMILLRERLDIPVVVSPLIPEGLEPQLREKLLAAGIAPLTGFSETLDALGAAATYGAQRAAVTTAGAPIMATKPPVAFHALDEAEGKALMASYGLPVPLGWSGPADQAARAAGQLGFPVVMKVLSTELLHKSKLGGVRLGLGSSAMVEEAVADMRRDLERHVPGHGLEQVLIEPMTEDTVAEIIIGLKRHPELGLALVIGTGGVDVEEARNYGLVLLPASQREIRTVVDHLGLGLTPAATRNLIAAARAVERFALDEADSIHELDINPVLVRSNDSVIAVDALVVLGQAEEHQS
jgi:acetate---CoA ligase (ADP-forming)